MNESEIATHQTKLTPLAPKKKLGGEYQRLLLLCKLGVRAMAVLRSGHLPPGPPGEEKAWGMRTGFQSDPLYRA